MTASPEICRLNGSKSRGPKTKRGKAIASRNATKHGLLSKKPPILITEDLETFQGIMQRLISEHQPQTTTEHLLIQQVAMGWFRLHRAWAAEAAITNLALLKAQQDAQCPQVPENLPQPLLDALTSKSFKEILQSEKAAIAALTQNLTPFLADSFDSLFDTVQWLASVEECLQSAINQCPTELLISGSLNEFWTRHLQVTGAIQALLQRSKQREGINLDPTEIQTALEKFLETARTRLQEIESQIAEFDVNAQRLSAEKMASAAFPSIDHVMRYESQISRQLHNALKQLTEIQKQRLNKGSMGSFGQKDSQTPGANDHLCEP
jgi:hypothetical protein